MINILLMVLLAIPLYLLPGIIFLWLCNIKGMNRWTRLFFSLCISLVIVLVTFIFVGNFLHFIPVLIPNLLLIAFLVVLVVTLRLIKKQSVIQSPELEFSVTRLEKFLAWTVIGFYALVTNLPSIGIFLQGENTLIINPSYQVSDGNSAY